MPLRKPLSDMRVHVVEPGYKITNDATGEVEVVDDGRVITVGVDLFCTASVLDAVTALAATRRPQ